MIDDSCEVPREDLDDGFNPCRKQVVENGELESYAHMYDVMNERYDREENTSYLNSVKRDRITQSTPSQTVGEGKLYAQDAQGVEGFVKSSGTLDPTTNAEIPSSKAVADYAPIPLPISKGGTGGNTPYVTNDLDSSAIFVMHDAPNDQYDAVPMSALMNYLVTLFPSLDSTQVIPEHSDLNDYINLGTYGLTSSLSAQTISNRPNIAPHGFKLFVYDTTPAPGYTSQLYLDLFGNIAQRHIDNGVWGDWNILTASSIPNPLPVNMGGTGVDARNYIAPESSLGILMTDNGETGDISSWTTVDALVGYVNSVKTQPEIAAAFAAHTATTVADNGLLPTNALMIDYVNAHSLNTPPSPFSYKVAPYPSGTWEGEMTVNVEPVFSVTIGTVEYIIARLYGAKKFNYNGTADNISLFSSIQPVEEYPYIFKNGTSIPLALNIQGRSYAAGTYGFNPRGSSSDVLLNDQTVPSVLSSANLNMSNSLNCVFGTGTNTPGVTVSFSCLTLMWRNLS